MTIRLPSVCDSCRNRISETACRAFDSIPDRIWAGGDNHTSPTHDQRNDVVWQFATGTERDFESWRLTQEIPPG